MFAAPEEASDAGAGGGQTRVDRPDFFGGAVGDVDLLMVGPDRGMNDHLASLPGALQPAWRGVSSMMLRRVYLGVNPYLKPWAVRVTRMPAAEGGALRSYPETAAIAPKATIACAAISAQPLSGKMDVIREGADPAPSDVIGQRSARLGVISLSCLPATLRSNEVLNG